MTGWFVEKLERYNVEGIDEEVIKDALLSQTNPFLSLVSDLEDFEVVRMEIPGTSTEQKEMSDGRPSNHRDLPSG